MKYFFNPLHHLKFFLFLFAPAAKKVVYSLRLYGVWLKQNQFQFGSGIKLQNPATLKLGKQVVLSDDVHLIIRKSKTPGAIQLANKVKIGPHSSFSVSADEKIVIGEGTSFHSNCRLNGDIKIGRWCLFASHIFISTTPHVFSHSPAMYIRDQDEKYQQTGQKNTVIIEDDCWIGWGVVIKEGITIGKGSIVGSNSVVVKDVAPYTIVGGIPAKVIKSRVELSVPTAIRVSDYETRHFFWNGFAGRDKEIVKINDKEMIAMDADSSLKINLKNAVNLIIKGHANQNSQIKIFQDDFESIHNIVPGSFDLTLKIANHNSNLIKIVKLQPTDQIFISEASTS